MKYTHTIAIVPILVKSKSDLKKGKYYTYLNSIKQTEYSVQSRKFKKEGVCINV